MRKFGWVLLIWVLAGCTPVDQDAGGALEFFADEAEFRAFVSELEQPGARPYQFGGCVGSEEDECETIVVTGSRIRTPSNPAITNNQLAGVDEGDIVKQIGDYLIVLQDGRLFSIDTAPDGGPVVLVDRIDVYRDPDLDPWIDEMLVAGDTVIVTEYSYEDDASGFSLFTVDADGQFARGETYYVRSSDYYSSDNYASRIIGDRLVFYVPVSLYQIWAAANEGEAFDWPGIVTWSRWQAEGDDAWSATPLLTAADILKPLETGNLRTLHLVVNCAVSDALECTATGVLSSQRSEYFVHNDAFYLWSEGADGTEAAEPTGLEQYGYCTPGGILERAPVNQLHRIPADGGQPGLMHVPGFPMDQFAMMANRGRFRALANWWDPACAEHSDSEAVLALVDVPISALSRSRPARARQVTLLPDPEGATEYGYAEARFTETHLAYARSEYWQEYPPQNAQMHEPAGLVIVPLKRPQDAHEVTLDHSAVRLDRLGDDFVMTGYRTGAGLHVSVVEPGSDTSRLAATTRLMNRFESENRSHAFNYVFDEDGVLMGLPTIKRPNEAGRWWWRSESSDLSFFRLNRNGGFIREGEVETGSGQPATGYVCEVSCIDWYGNSRPIFTGGRVFALMGTELVEISLNGDYLRELARVDLTETPPRPSSDPMAGGTPP